MNSQLKIYNNQNPAFFKISIESFNRNDLAQINLIQRGWPRSRNGFVWSSDKWFSEFYGVISSTPIAAEGHRNPTRTVHPFHGWIFQFRGIFVARVGQFERTKEAVDPGENWPSLSVPPIARIIRGGGRG